MKKLWLIPILLIGVIVLDLGWVAVFERPLFAIKDDSDSVDQKYYGLFYDVVDCLESETRVLKKGSKYACPTSTVTEYAAMVMVDGTLYVYSGMWHEFAKCGVMDGEITSFVSADTLPFKDNQANFTGATGYQFGQGDTLEINVEGKWHIFMTEEKLAAYKNYPIVTDLIEIEDADNTILVRFEGDLYAKSNAVVDVEVTGDPDGIIDTLIPVEYVPVQNEETNQEEYYMSLVYGNKEDSSILLCVDGVYELFVKVEE